jgi:hypothetical protein
MEVSLMSRKSRQFFLYLPLEHVELRCGQPPMRYPLH